MTNTITAIEIIAAVQSRASAAKPFNNDVSNNNNYCNCFAPSALRRLTYFAPSALCRLNCDFVQSRSEEKATSEVASSVCDVISGSLPAWRWYVNQRSEQTVVLLGWSSRKKKRIRRSVGTAAVTELKCP